MTQSLTKLRIDWSPIFQQMQRSVGERLPVYPGDLKADLLGHAGLADHPKAEAAFQLAKDISRSTTCCDPEIAYWFSRLATLIEP